jgi:hypothetical protein
VAIAIFLALLLSVRVTLNIVYRDKLSIYLRVLFIKVQLYPTKEKKFNAKKYEKKLKKKENKSNPVIRDNSQEEKPPATITDNIKLVTEILSVFFKALPRHLHVKLAKLHIKVATGDAAQTAILYGAVSGAVACLIELLDSITNLSHLKTKSISIVPDYLSDKSDVDVNISLSISSFGVISTLGKSLWKFIMLKYIKK